MKSIGMACIKLTDAEIDAAVKVLRSGALRQGHECDSFEAEFCSKTGAKYGVVSANGSSALHLAYMAFLEPGDEVLVPSFTFIATGSMVSMSGGIPVICDIDPDTFLLDLADAEKKITPKTKAIAPVHIFGNPCDLNEYTAFAQKHGLKIVWDAAQAHGAKFKGADIGSAGDFVSYSFYPSKNMFVGEGGITLTNSEEYDNAMRYMRTHGQTGKYYHTMLGLNYRMTDVEAAIGREQLKRLDKMLQIRLRNATMLNEGLADIAGITPQKITDGGVSAWHQYCVRIDKDVLGMDREAVQKKLKDQGIASGVHYPRGMHQQPIFESLYGACTLPETEKLCEQILAIPVHHGLSEEDVQYVVETMQGLTA